MSTAQQPDFKEAQSATVTTLTGITHDPIDAMRLAADLFAMSAFRAERAVAVEAGTPAPRAPEPISKYMRTFALGISAKVNALAGMFDAAELARLKKLAPGLVRQMELNDPRLAEEIYNLVCMSSDEAAAWIRERLETFEARFAS
jgi:hypothetical protein